MRARNWIFPHFLPTMRHERFMHRSVLPNLQRCLQLSTMVTNLPMQALTSSLRRTPIASMSPELLRIDGRQPATWSALCWMTR